MRKGDEMSDKKPHVYLGFKDSKLITIIISRNSNRETAIDCDYYIDQPKDVKKQIEAWLSQL